MSRMPNDDLSGMQYVEQLYRGRVKTQRLSHVDGQMGRGDGRVLVDAGRCINPRPAIGNGLTIQMEECVMRLGGVGDLKIRKRAVDSGPATPVVRIAGKIAQP